jgi:uncharacterized protein YbaR (Trm112 family)
MSASPERLDGTVDPKLLEILVCPVTKGPLEFDSTRQELISRSAKLAYPIRDGIPIMLPEERGRLSEDGHSLPSLHPKRSNPSRGITDRWLLRLLPCAAARRLSQQ